MFKTILIPTDGSALSRKAIALGVKLAKATGAGVVGVFAAPAPTPVVYRDHLPVGFVTPQEHAKMMRDTAGQYLGAVARAAKKAGVRYEGVQATSDFPAEVILTVARKKRCGLIVMASHGRRGLRGVLLGSETQKVLTHAKIPVLVCR